MEVNSLGQTLSWSFTASISQSAVTRPPDTPEAISPPTQNGSLNYIESSLSEVQIQSYFESSAPQKAIQSFEDLGKNEGLTSLFDLQDPDKERRLRALLHRIDRENDLQEILFGSKAVPEKESEWIEEMFVDMDLRIQFRISSQQKEAPPLEAPVEISPPIIDRREADPLIIDLGGDGLQTTGVDRGIHFDLDADGQKEQISFVDGNDFALALDRNKNHRIDSGRELFGDQRGSQNGFDELSRLDENRDGRIDRQDSVFSQLLLLNKQGSLSLSQANIESLDLNYLKANARTSAGDRISETGLARMRDGSTRDMADVWFKMR